MVIYLMWHKPLESPFAVRMEVMNECTIIVLTYGHLCFTDFVPEEEIRSEIGWVYIGVTIANILVHLTFLLLTSCHKMKIVCKRYCC